MVSTQDILNGIVNMQSEAQSALPVIPNNGNPGGANNMPHTAETQPAIAAALPKMAGPSLPWLQSSQSMQNIRDMLRVRNESFKPRQTAYQPHAMNTSAIPQENPLVMPMFSNPTV